MSYIEFVEHAPSKSGKTQIWHIRSIDQGTKIGSVAWYPGWRKYVATLWQSTMWEEACLRDVAAFVEAATREHKARRGAA